MWVIGFPFLDFVNKEIKTEENGLSYVHITSKIATSAESFIYLNETRSNVGRYVAVIYRTKNADIGEVFITGSGMTTGNGNCKFTCDKNASDWTLGVFDFSKDTDCGWDEYTPITAWRWDINNGITDPTNAYFDIAAVAFFDSAEAAQAYYASFAELYCTPTAG